MTRPQSLPFQSEVSVDEFRQFLQVGLGERYDHASEVYEAFAFLGCSYRFTNVLHLAIQIDRQDSGHLVDHILVESTSFFLIFEGSALKNAGYVTWAVQARHFLEWCYGLFGSPFPDQSEIVLPCDQRPASAIVPLTGVRP